MLDAVSGDEGDFGTRGVGRLGRRGKGEDGKRRRRLAPRLSDSKVMEKRKKREGKLGKSRRVIRNIAKGKKCVDKTRRDEQSRR